jgi:hypothetical protein
VKQKFFLKKGNKIEIHPYNQMKFEFFKDLYEDLVLSRGKFSAGIWLWKEIFKSLPGFIWAVLY